MQEKKEEKTIREQCEESNTDDTEFTSFICSLATSALVHLGEMKNPETGKTEVNLSMAKQTIDILAMLRKKTVGNLSSDEQKMLDSMLYQLQMKFVELSNKPIAQPPASEK